LADPRVSLHSLGYMIGAAIPDAELGSRRWAHCKNRPAVVLMLVAYVDAG